ncbi:MAG: endopeptidase La [Deltaproteobacteria bacterium]|nr:MAG: endopeptidase La [Deltaproteobacteria bacterium]
MEEMEHKLPEILPILPVRDSVIFPRMVVPLMIRDEEYVKLVDEVLQKDKLLVVSMIKDPEKTERPPEVFRVGTAGIIVKLTKAEEGTVLVVQGISRVAITEIVSDESYQKARIKELKDVEHTGKEIEAMMVNALNLFKQIIDLSPHLPPELVQLSRNVDQPGPLADMIISTLNLDRNKKQEILESLDVKDRLSKLMLFLNEELELQKMGKEIQDRVRKGIDKSQREYFLREQLKAIQKELGIDNEEPTEISELKERLKQKALPDQVREVAKKEIDRLSKMSPMSPEYTVSRTYLDWILDLPWREATEDTIDITKARKVLDKYHYNLEKVKKRILEYLAVRKLNPDHKGPILCFVGPPGTGKTSLGKAIAEAMGRKFVRISLGGVRDEAEIRGHRRTYVGALPGRIIQGIKKAGSNNPVFMLDEVDKLGMDFRGDPSSALLEVLDPEQNNSFSDHYLELEFDLSRVMFIATANQLDPIPSPLRDRMEIIELAGYTEDEKLEIATKFLIPRQISEHGLKRSQVKFRRSALRKIIREYTREAGLRNLEREIGAICRGVAKEVAEGKKGGFVISAEEVKKYLGKPKFTPDVAERTSVPGVAIGMAWTPTGGDILFIEATMMPGNKALVLTGQLGDVMKESAQAALSYLRSRAEELGISKDFYKDKDIHIHVPAGAIPKDGPSAGVTMLTALASLVTGKPVKRNLAMTGEVTLRGLVLPVGGIKEKVLAANRSGIKQIILPKENQNDLDEIPEKIRKQTTFHLVSRMDGVLEIALGLNHKGSTQQKNRKK